MVGRRPLCELAARDLETWDWDWEGPLSALQFQLLFLQYRRHGLLLGGLRPSGGRGSFFDHCIIELP